MTVTLIGAFAELGKHQDQVDKIYEEVKDIDATDFKVLESLPHLNGVIKEVMRLYPSVLSGGSRKTLNESVIIGGKVIPPRTTIVAPRYTINRSKSCPGFLEHNAVSWGSTDADIGVFPYRRGLL